MSNQESNLPKIGNPATNALRHIGITQLEQLSTWSEAELLKVHGVGPKAVGILREAMQAKGLSFKK